jgi:hypothetical protein
MVKRHKCIAVADFPEGTICNINQEVRGPPRRREMEQSVMETAGEVSGGMISASYKIETAPLLSSTHVFRAPAVHCIHFRAQVSQSPHTAGRCGRGRGGGGRAAWLEEEVGGRDGVCIQKKRRGDVCKERR